MDHRKIEKKLNELEDLVTRLREQSEKRRHLVAQFVIAAALKIEDPLQKEAVMSVFKSLYESWDKL